VNWYSPSILQSCAVPSIADPTDGNGRLGASEVLFGMGSLLWVFSTLLIVEWILPFEDRCKTGDGLIFGRDGNNFLDDT
jgi:hypothetical protein